MLPSKIDAPYHTYLDDLVNLEVLEGWIQGHPEEKTQTAVSQGPWEKEDDKAVRDNNPTIYMSRPHQTTDWDILLLP